MHACMFVCTLLFSGMTGNASVWSVNAASAVRLRLLGVCTAYGSITLQLVVQGAWQLLAHTADQLNLAQMVQSCACWASPEAGVDEQYADEGGLLR